MKEMFFKKNLFGRGEIKIREVGYCNSCPTTQHCLGGDSVKAPGLL